MKSSTLFRSIAASIFLAMLTGAAYAGDTTLDFTLGQPEASVYRVPDLHSYVLAANEDVTTTGQANATVRTESRPMQPKPEKDSWYSLNKVHRHLGISTILLAAATAATAPGEGCEVNCQPNQPRDTNGTHGKLGKATGYFAAATVLTGLMAHWDDIHWDNGITDPDNLHALLGVTGAALMVDAIRRSAAQKTGTVSHAGQAELGAALMVLAIKTVW